MLEQSKARLLIVDDEADVLEVLVEALASLDISQGFEIATAKNGHEALKMIGSQGFDAVLSDINMPIMSGLEFLYELRKAGKETPVIFITGAGDKDRAVEALRLGCFDFLDKPWNHEKLISSVTQALLLGCRLRDLDHETEKYMSKFKSFDEESQRQLLQSYRSLMFLKYAALVQSNHKKTGS
jgi:DNA-binding NtrC family response regulator